RRNPLPTCACRSDRDRRMRSEETHTVGAEERTENAGDGGFLACDDDLVILVRPEIAPIVFRDHLTVCFEIGPCRNPFQLAAFINDPFPWDALFFTCDRQDAGYLLRVGQ